MELYLRWSFSFTKITGLNEVTHSLGIYILKHFHLNFNVSVYFLKEPFFLQFCLFLDVMPFFTAIVLIVVRRKKKQKKQKPRITKPYSNKKNSLCFSMKALSVPKRVYDKCDSPLFIASALQQRCVMEFNISATEIIRILRCRPVTEMYLCRPVTNVHLIVTFKVGLSPSKKNYTICLI